MHFEFLSCTLCNLLLREGRQRPDHTQASGCPGEPPRRIPGSEQPAPPSPPTTPSTRGQRQSAVQTDAHVCGDRWRKTQQNQRAPRLQRQRGGSLNLPFSFDLRPYLPLLLHFTPVCFLPLVSLGGSGLCSSTNLHLGNTALGFQRHLRACPSSRTNLAFTERVSCSPSEHLSPRLGDFSPPQGT